MPGGDGVWGVFFLAQAGRAEPSTSPIVIRPVPEKAAEVTINGTDRSLEDASAWLAKSVETFGVKDPVIVLCTQETPVGVAAQLVDLAKRTHDRVYLAVLTNEYQTGEMTWLIAPTEGSLRELEMAMSSVLPLACPAPLK